VTGLAAFVTALTLHCHLAAPWSITMSHRRPRLPNKPFFLAHFPPLYTHPLTHTHPQPHTPKARTRRRATQASRAPGGWLGPSNSTPYTVNPKLPAPLLSVNTHTLSLNKLSLSLSRSLSLSLSLILAHTHTQTHLPVLPLGTPLIVY